MLYQKPLPLNAILSTVQILKSSLNCYDLVMDVSLLQGSAAVLLNSTKGLIPLCSTNTAFIRAGAVYVYHGATVLLFITVLLVLVDKVRLAY